MEVLNQRSMFYRADPITSATATGLIPQNVENSLSVVTGDDFSLLNSLGPNDFLNSFNDVSFVTDRITLKDFNNFANKEQSLKQATIMESKSLLKDLLGFDSEVNHTSFIS